MKIDLFVANGTALNQGSTNEQQNIVAWDVDSLSGGRTMNERNENRIGICRSTRIRFTK